jgi:hypothetical protein
VFLIVTNIGFDLVVGPPFESRDYKYDLFRVSFKLVAVEAYIYLGLYNKLLKGRGSSIIFVRGRDSKSFLSFYYSSS